MPLSWSSCLWHGLFYQKHGLHVKGKGMVCMPKAWSAFQIHALQPCSTAFLLLLAFLAFFAFLTVFCYFDLGILWMAHKDEHTCWLPPLSLATSNSFRPYIPSNSPNPRTWETETLFSPEFPKIEKLFLYFSSLFPHFCWNKNKTRPIAINRVLRVNSNWPTNQPTDGPTNRVAYRVACMRPKKAIDRSTNGRTKEWPRPFIEMRRCI